MARLNIDETYFASTLNRELQAALGWNENEVLGFLAHLWHDSQLNLNYSGTKQDILTWSRVKFTHPDQSDDIIPALLESGLLEYLGKGLYYICGSHDKIQGLRNGTKLGKKSFNPLDERKSSPRGAEIRDPGVHDSENFSKIEENQQDSAGCRKTPPHSPITELKGTELKGTDTGLKRTETELTMKSKKKKKGAKKSAPSPVAIAQGSSLKSKVPAIWKARITPDDKQLAQKWFDRAQEITPKSKYSLEKFEDALCRIRFDYKFSSEHLVQLFEFIKEDDFWKHNVVSPSSLLKPSKSEPEITKLMQVVRSLKNKPKTEEELLQESFARRRAKEQQEANYFDEPIDMEHSHEIR